MNFRDEAIKLMYKSLKSFLKCGYRDMGKKERGWIKCAPNDDDFVNGLRALEITSKEMPWIQKCIDFELTEEEG